MSSIFGAVHKNLNTTVWRVTQLVGRSGLVAAIGFDQCVRSLSFHFEAAQRLDASITELIGHRLGPGQGQSVVSFGAAYGVTVPDHSNALDFAEVTFELLCQGINCTVASAL